MPVSKRKQRNATDGSSYTGVEKLISASQHQSSGAPTQYKKALLSELRTEQFNNTHMAKNKKTAASKKAAVSAQDSNTDSDRARKKQLFSFPIFIPAVVGVLVLGIIITSFVVFRSDDPQPGGEVTGPLVIHQNVSDEDIENAFSLSALQEDASGVNPKTSFQLISTVQTSVDQIKDSLSFSPSVAYAVEATDSNTYRVTPEAPLEAGSMVAATMNVQYQGEGNTMMQRNFSWSYQVQETFQVLSTLPRNAVTSVPVDTSIEIEFSHTDVQDIEENFTITPEVSGRFEMHRKSAVFIPDAPLKKGTVYTVTLKKETHLSSPETPLQEDLVFMFETSSKDTDTSYTPGITQIQQVSNETSTLEKPVFIVSGWDLEDIEETTLAFYEFSDQGQFEAAFDNYIAVPQWASYSQSHWSYSTEGLQLHSSTSVPLQDIGNYWQFAIEAPQPLEQGWYLVEVLGRNDENYYALLQVEDITAYVTTSEKDMVVWAHDATTQDPLVGAEVKLSDGTSVGTTDASGLLQVDTPDALTLDDNTSTHAVTIVYGASTLFVPLSGNAQGYSRYKQYGNSATSDPYWSYIYLDQPFYLPDATMNIWGLLSSRDASAVSSASIEIRDGYDFDDPESIVYKKTLSPGTYGTFEHTVDLPNLLPDYYTLTLTVDGEVITYKSFDILTYQKPAYTLDVDPANIGVISGEDVTHTVTASFFDGTPVTSVDIELDGQNLTTNDQGVVEYTHAYSGEGSYYDERIDTQWLHARPALSEEGNISAEARVRVFPSSQLIDVDSTVKESTATVNGTLYELDLAGFNDGTFDFFEDPYGSTVANHELSATVTRRWYKKNQTGTRYDAIDKKVVPVYEYEYKNKEILSTTVTSDSNGTFNFDFDMLDGSSYDVAVRSTDSQGRTIRENAYASVGYGATWSDGDLFSIGYTSEGGEGEAYMSVKRDFSLGETVSVGMYRNDDLLATEEYPAFLFVQAQNGIMDVDTSQEATYEFPFAEEHIPNVVLQGVWYDGRSYWSTDTDTGMWSRGTVASYQEEDREMQIEVVQDKDSYEPGDDVTLNITATRPDGSASETVLNVNLVDEALYAILPERSYSFTSDYTKGFNVSLYRDVASGILTSYASHRYPSKETYAEGGGGQGSRSNFPDKALFKTVTTNEHGKAQIQFTLPDNITSWRINTHAVDSGLYAASSIEKLTVTQPFFVAAVLNKTYLADDLPVVKVRAFGTALTQADAVALTWESDTLGVEETPLSTSGSTPVELTLPALSAGKHSITVAGEAVGYSDAITRSFTVLPSYTAIPFSEMHDAVADWKPVVDTDRNFSVTFADKNKGQFYSYLRQRAYSFGDRLDQQVGRAIATTLLNEHFDAGMIEDTITTSEYQALELHGLTLYPYTDEDLVLSAHVAASRMADQFDTARLASYFEGILNNSSETTLRHAISLYGLAGLQQPVLVEIREVLNSTEITDIDRLYLTLALAELGSYDEAEILYEAFKTKYAKEHDQYMYVELGDNKDYQLENTLVMANIAAHIQDDSADAFFNYVRDNWTKEIVLMVPEMNFMEARLDVLPQSSTTVTYALSGEEHTAELKEGKTHTVALTSLSKDSFKVVRVDGAASAIVEYTRKPTADELQSDDRIAVLRSYEKTTVQDGDLVRITITPSITSSAPDGLYQVTDFVPSGLRIVTNPYEYTQWNYENDFRSPYRVDGQRASFIVSKWDNNPTFTYYARVLSKGTYAAEQPVMQSMNSPSVRTIGNQETITIE